MIHEPQPPAIEPEEPEPGPGRIRPTGPGPLVVLGLVGMVAGWAVRGIAIRAGTPVPGVSWTAIGLTWFVAALVAGTAYATWRVMRPSRSAPGAALRRLTPQQGLTRLVLGKTIARLGAFVLGGYAGIVVSRLGVDGANAYPVIARGLLGALGAGAGLAAGLLLEHACRVPPRRR